jgi:choline dehydrogenase
MIYSILVNCKGQSVSALLSFWEHGAAHRATAAREMRVLIVGGGSAGCVLARRLTEDPSCEVTLLETGGDVDTHDPPSIMRSANPWQIIEGAGSEPFRFPALLSRRAAGQEPKVYWRGRGLGGSSAVNGMQTIRGTPEDFDELWVGLRGCEGFGSKDVLPYYRKLESDRDFGDADAHGADGPLPITRSAPERWGGSDRTIYDACLELGYGEVADHNAFERNLVGMSAFARNDLEPNDGERSTTGTNRAAAGGRAGRISAYDAFLAPVRDDPSRNLTVVTGAHVERVLFDGAQRATGVQAAVGGGPSARYDADHVILCGGAVHSPAILQRSGIGPAALLESLAIPQVAALPVGHNLQDHPGIKLAFTLKPHLRATSADVRHTSVVGRYSSGVPGAGAADMQLVATNFGVLNLDAPPDDPAWGVGGVVAILNEVFSQGELTVTSPDSHVEPTIEENMGSDPRDLARLVDAAERLLTIGETQAVRDAAVEGEPVGLAWNSPGTGVDVEAGGGSVVTRGMWEAMSRAEQEAWVVNNCADSQHASGTCRMGKADDPAAVVDLESRVIGVDGLSVVDASIMPSSVRGNIHLTVLMLAEMMADKLKQQLLQAEAAGAEVFAEVEGEGAAHPGGSSRL